MASALEVKVHPLVLFNIVDSYERRSEDPKRVIGTLLGKAMNKSSHTVFLQYFLNILAAACYSFITHNFLQGS